jgi:hypothetical protein
MSQQFYVVGGEYADTNFSTPAAGSKLESHGPFYSEAEAQAFWRDITGKSVDNAMVRYFIKSVIQEENNYFVIGGEYADTTFTKIMDGKKLEKYGPFSEDDARLFWRGITSQTVDSCTHRYSIATKEKVEKLEAEQ